MVTKFFEIATELFIFCTIVAIAIVLLMKGVDLSNKYKDKIAQEDEKITESAYTKYNGIIVSGADVINAIRNNKNSVKVEVARIIEEDGEVQEKAEYDASFVNLPQNDNYINPNAQFYGEIERNKNGAISNLVFTQQKFVYSAQVSDSDNSTGDDTGGGTGNGSGDVTTGEFFAALQTYLEGVTEALTNIDGKLSNFGNGIGGGGADDVGTDAAITEDDIEEIATKLTESIEPLIKTLQGSELTDESGERVYIGLTDVYQKLGEIANSTGNGDAITDYATSTQVDGVSTKVDNVSAQIVNLGDSLTSLSSALSSLTEYVKGDEELEEGDSLVGMVKDLNTTLVDLQAQVADLQETVNTINKNTGGTE